MPGYCSSLRFFLTCSHHSFLARNLSFRLQGFYAKKKELGHINLTPWNLGGPSRDRTRDLLIKRAQAAHNDLNKLRERLASPVMTFYSINPIFFIKSGKIVEENSRGGWTIHPPLFTPRNSCPLSLSIHQCPRKCPRGFSLRDFLPYSRPRPEEWWGKLHRNWILRKEIMDPDSINENHLETFSMTWKQRRYSEPVERP